MGIMLVSTVISCPDPSTILDVVSLPSPSSSVEQEAEGIIPYPWELSLAFLSSKSHLDKYVFDGVVRVAMSSDEEGTLTFNRLEYPDLDSKGGPGSKFPLPSLIKVLMDDLRGQAARF